VLDQEYSSAPASTFVSQKDHEQVMQIIELDGLKLEAQLGKRPRQKILDTVIWRINPYQVQIFAKLTFADKMIEEGTERRLHATSQYGEWPLAAQAAIQIGRGGGKRRDARHRFRTGSL